MRVVIEFRKDLHDKSLRHLCIVKGNYLPEEEKSSSFVFKMKDDMVLENTGKRMDFDLLSYDEKEKELEIEVKEIYQDGTKGLREISDELKVKIRDRCLSVLST